MKRTTSFLAKASMMLLAVLFSLTGARAQNELTVYDGTNESGTIPFYGLYADTQGAASECVIPSDELTVMTGNTITAMTFYLQQAATGAWTGTHQVYIGEVEETTLTGITGPDAFTVVATGSFDATGTELTVVFDDPYTYGGGNLLIGTYVSVAGSWRSAHFYGVNQHDYTAWLRKSASEAGNGQQFLPKTTFTYIAGGVVIVEKPQTFEVSGITSSGAVLAWTGGTGIYNVEYKKAADEEWTAAIANTTANTYTLTGLESNTAYQARVQSVSGSEVSGWKTLSFTTTVDFPYIEDFTEGFPTSWTRYIGLLENILDNTATLAPATSAWGVDSGNDVLDGKHARVNIYGSGIKHWLVTPTVPISTNARLAFDVAYTAYNGTAVAPAQTGEDDKFVVLISNDNMATWTILRQWDNAGSTYVLNDLTPDGESVAIALDGYAGQSVNVAFYVESTVGNADNNLHIDNVAFQETPSCEKPAGLKVNYDGGTEATVSWVSEEPYFDIDVNGTITEDVENPYTLTNLELATTYIIKVRARNGSGVSDWAGPVSFATNISDDMCQIKLVLIDSYGDSWNGNAIKIVDVATGIVIGTYTNQNLNGTSGGGENEENTLYVSVPNDRDIEFQWVSGSYANECSYAAYDVNGEEIFSGSGAMTAPVTYHVDCVVTPFRTPTNFAVSEITKNSAKLSWTENGTATEWVINVYDETNDDSFGEFTTSENPYTLTGLTPETEYTAVVRPAGENAKWSAPISFTTPVAFPAPTELAVDKVKATSAEISWTGNDDASSYNLRYVTINSAVAFFDDFENGLDDWTLIVNAEGTGWQTFDATQFSGGSNYSGDYVAMARSYEGGADITADNWMITPQITIGKTMTYWARNDGYENHQYDETYDVCVSTSSNNPEDFVIVQTFTTTPYEWEQITIDLSTYNGQQGYVAFHHHDAEKDLLLIDDVTIVSFTGDTEESWTTINNVTSPYTIGGLAPETKYQVQVQAVYAEGESQWTATSFKTKGYLDVPTDLTADVTSTTATLNWNGVQESYNVRYRENPVFYFTPFNSDEDRFGWSFSNAIYGLDDTAYNIPGSNNFFLSMGWSTTDEEFIISPELPEYESGAILEFHHFYYITENTFQIGYSTTTNDLESFAWSEPITSGSREDAYAIKYSEVLPDGVKFVAFKATASNQSACIFIDNFRIYKFVAEPGDWISASVDETTLTLTGLTPGTGYEWQVQGIYNSEPTEWSEVATFTTLATDPVPANLQTTDIASTTATLSWEGKQDNYNVKLTKLPVVNVNNFTQVGDDYTATGELTEYNIDLSSYSGTGAIAIRHYNVTDMFRLNVDDIVVRNAASEVVLSEDFESGLFPSEWINYDADDDGNVWAMWQITSQDSQGNDVGNGSYCITSASYNGSALTPDNWLIIPNVELGGTLTFVARGQDPSWAAEVFGVFVGVDAEAYLPAAETTFENVTSPYTLEGLLPGTDYAVQVQGIYSGGTTEWSEAVGFTTSELLELANDATDNSAIIAAKDGKVTDVQLTGRTLYKDGEWNTICLPFALDATELAASPLADGDIRTLDNFAVEGTTVSLNFTAEGAVTEIEAGKPYLIRWTSGKHIVSPLFTSVTVNKTMNDVVCTAGEKAVTFKGNYDKMIYSEDNTSVLFFDDDNNLDYPLAGTSIGAMRGYFQLAGLTADGIEFVTNLNVYDPDGISLTPALSEGEGDWYDLGGRKLAGKPTMKGIYVNGGRKVTIK